MKYDSLTLAASGLRFLLGWYMFFAGVEKVINPEWTASGFLLGAKTFSAFYAWFAAPAQSVWVDPLNAWGITLVGAALLLGLAVRPAAIAGAVLMILYYFPHNAFPYVPHGFIVEEHIIYAAAFILILIALMPAAERPGLAYYARQSPLGRLPFLRRLL